MSLIPIVWPRCQLTSTNQQLTLGHGTIELVDRLLCLLCRRVLDNCDACRAARAVILESAVRIETSGVNSR